MPDFMKKPIVPGAPAIETGEVKQKRYARQENIRPEDVPSQETLEQMKRQMQYDAMDKAEERAAATAPTTKRNMGKVFAKGGKVASASRRADGIAQRGKTKGRII